MRCFHLGSRQYSATAPFIEDEAGQGTDDPALVTTARLKANRGDCERAQPCDQLGPAGCVVTHGKEPPLTTTSKRSFDTSIPQKESMAIFVSHPCCCGRGPWQLVGYGRSDWSTKLIHGLTSEEAAGFRSRREFITLLGGAALASTATRAAPSPRLSSVGAP